MYAGRDAINSLKRFFLKKTGFVKIFFKELIFIKKKSVAVSSLFYSWTGYKATVVLKGLVWTFSLGFQGLVEDWFSKNPKPLTRENEFFQNQS